MKKISIGGFTNREAYKKQPFWLLRNEPERLLKHKLIIMQGMYDRLVDQNIVEFFEIAFDYFIKNIKHYDGASGDVELHKVHGYTYDIGAIMHDYLDAVNYTVSIKTIRTADKVLFKVMEQLHDSTYHIDKRAALLYIAAPLRYLNSKYISKRQSTTAPFNDAKIALYIEEYTNGYTFNYSRIRKVLAGAIATFALPILIYIIF
jgi:hypothetical protein